MSKKLLRFFVNNLKNRLLIYLHRAPFRWIITSPRIYGRHYPSDILRHIIKEYPEYKGIDILIETGTFKGDVAWYESHLFKEIHTVEIKRELYEKAQARLKNKSNVICYCGNSAEVLPEILKKIRKRCILLLDAHWSGDSSVNWEESCWKGWGVDTGYRGDKTTIPSAENQTPLKNEVESIAKLHHYPSVIIIDDWISINTKDRAFKGENWTHINIDEILYSIGRENIRAIFTMDTAPKIKDAKMLIILLK